MPIYITVASSMGKPIDYVTLIKIRLKSDYLTSIDRLIHAVRICESGMNDFAIGSAGDWGPLQITIPRLNDYNKQAGKHYSHEDCFKWEVSKEIFLFYAGRIGFLPTNFDEICRRWNRSSNWQDEKGQQYWNKVFKQINKLTNVQNLD